MIILPITQKRLRCETKCHFIGFLIGITRDFNVLTSTEWNEMSKTWINQGIRIA